MEFDLNKFYIKRENISPNIANARITELKKFLQKIRWVTFTMFVFVRGTHNTNDHLNTLLLLLPLPCLLLLLLLMVWFFVCQNMQPMTFDSGFGYAFAYDGLRCAFAFTYRYSSRNIAHECTHTQEKTRMVRFQETVESMGDESRHSYSLYVSLCVWHLMCAKHNRNTTHFIHDFTSNFEYSMLPLHTANPSPCTCVCVCEYMIRELRVQWNRYSQCFSRLFGCHSNGNDIDFQWRNKRKRNHIVYQILTTDWKVDGR